MRYILMNQMSITFTKYLNKDYLVCREHMFKHFVINVEHCLVKCLSVVFILHFITQHAY